jgi:alpha-D-ribose 1-methylphosphonate 5-triphosphate synthase subunit PhnG
MDSLRADYRSIDDSTTLSFRVHLSDGFRHYSVVTDTVFTENPSKVWETPRQKWLRDLALAPTDFVVAQVHAFLEERSIVCTIIKESEVGLCLIPGRVSGVGEAFGLGEATITRCVVKILDEVGVGYVLGRREDHAFAAACGDALLQSRWSTTFEMLVLEPCREIRRVEEAQFAERAGATKVEFETLSREA